MFTVKNYAIVKDLEEAYRLNQKRNNVIIGGMMWLKMGSRNIQTAIDLSELGLNQVVETNESFQIGCMVTLRELEVNHSLNQYFNGMIAESVKNIVGVQFRNGATIGGSIYGRFGFSDPLTCFLVLDAYVELYKGGILPLSEFIHMSYDNDILVRLIIKKDQRKVSYLTYRNSATDIPVITCAVAKEETTWRVALGARPARAKLVIDTKSILSENPTEEEIEQFITVVQETVTYSGNMRGSKEYRTHLAGVLLKRGINKIVESKVQ